MFLTGRPWIKRAMSISASNPTVREGAAWQRVCGGLGRSTDHGRGCGSHPRGCGQPAARQGAIYAGFAVLAEQVGIALEDVQQMFIGGSFGKYINVEKAVQIGLLPDLPLGKIQLPWKYIHQRRY